MDKQTLETAVILLGPFAPHLAEELWEQLGHDSVGLCNRAGPEYDEQYLKDDEMEIAVQMNGKTINIVVRK